MKRSLILAAIALVIPVAVEAQVIVTGNSGNPAVELGFDGGAEINVFDGDNVTSFGFPTGTFRLSSVSRGSLWS